MQRIFWLPIAAIFMIPGALTRAQVYALRLFPLLSLPKQCVDVGQTA